MFETNKWNKMFFSFVKKILILISYPSVNSKIRNQNLKILQILQLKCFENWKQYIFKILTFIMYLSKKKYKIQQKYICTRPLPKEKLLQLATYPHWRVPQYCGRQVFKSIVDFIYLFLTEYYSVTFPCQL